MLSANEELQANSLRTLREALREAMGTDTGTGAIALRASLELCDRVVVRMLAALEDAKTDAAARLEGQRQARRLFDQLPNPSSNWTPSGRARLATLIANEARTRDRQESLAARIAEESPARRPAVTVERLQAYFGRRFPAGKLKVLRSDAVPIGRSKLTVLVVLEPNDSVPSALVLRRDKPGSAAETTVADEFPVLRAMNKVRVRAPAALWLEQDPAVLGAPFLVMQRVEGRPPQQDPASPIVPAVIRSLAETLAELHRADPLSAWPTAPTSARGAVAQMIRDYEARWRACTRVSSITLEIGYGWLRQQLERVAGPSVPVHGDVRFANVLAQRDRVECLTDWEFAHAGHAAEDLAFCRKEVEAVMPWAQFLGHYTAAGGLPVSEEQLKFFGVWIDVRNLTIAQCVLESCFAGRLLDVQNLTVGLDERPQLEASLSRTLAEELARQRT